MTLTNRQFTFGKNWKNYIDRYLDERSIAEAEKSLSEFLNSQTLHEKTFMDIGCGSGIFSYAAYKLGASKIVSFDVDEDSVLCCERMKSMAGNPPNWDVLCGSILDERFTGSLTKADVVYSWGVLHHTGNMWTAIKKAANLVHPGGLLFISIYNKVEYNILKNYRGSYLWLKIKKIYNKSGSLRKKILEWSYMLLAILKMAATKRNPIREICAYKDKYRGMSWRTDVTDWLGGYPYEFATAEEISYFCSRELNLKLLKLKPGKNLGCNQFLFAKKP